jgi:hypothetical protein
MNVHFKKFKILDKLCVFAIPPKLNCTLSSMYREKWRDHVEEMRKLVGIGMTHNIPPTLNVRTLDHETINDTPTTYQSSATHCCKHIINE